MQEILRSLRLIIGRTWVNFFLQCDLILLNDGRFVPFHSVHLISANQAPPIRVWWSTHPIKSIAVLLNSSESRMLVLLEATRDSRFRSHCASLALLGEWMRV